VSNIKEKLSRKLQDYPCSVCLEEIANESLIEDILSLTDNRWYAEDECDECGGDGCTSEHDPMSCNCHTTGNSCPVQVGCEKCQGTGKRDATIQEILDGKAVKR